MEQYARVRVTEKTCPSLPASIPASSWFIAEFSIDQ